MKRRPAIKLDETRFINQVESDKNADEASTSTLRSNRATWNELAQNEPRNVNAETDVSEKKQEYAPKMPLIPMTIEQIQPRLINAFHQGKPFVRMNPTDQNDVQIVRQCQDFMNWIIMNHIPRFNHIFDENSLITITEGQSFVFQTWVRDERKVCHQHEFQATRLEQGPYGFQETSMTVDQIIFELFDAGGTFKGARRLIDWQEAGEDRYKIDYEIKRDPSDKYPWTQHQAVMNLWQDDVTGNIIVKYVANEVVFEGVKLINQNLDHLFFPVDIDSLQPGDCPHVIIRTSKSLSEIEQRHKSGDYDLLNQEKMEKIRKVLADKKPQDENGAQAAIRDIEDTETSEFPEDIVEVWECYYSKDIDDDGINEEIIVTIFPEARVIARIRHLDEVFHHGKRPLDVVYFDIRPYSIFGKGIPEKGKSLQEIYDDLWRQMLNYNEVITLPFFFYLAGGSMDNQVYKLRPGEGYPLSSLDDIRFPQFPNNLGTSFAELQMLWATWERYMKINDPMMGRQGQARQTATATLKLLAESMEAMSVNFYRYKLGWADIFMNTWQLYRAYMPDYMKFRVWDPMAQDGQGDWDFRNMARKDMIAHPDIDLNINVEQTSKIFQRELYTALFQQLVNPLTIQMGICTPGNTYNVLDRLLDAFDIKDKANFITRPPALPPPMDPKQEINIMAQGQYVSPSPQENINHHLAVHQAFMMSPQYQLVPINYRPLFEQHIMETMAIAQQQQQMIETARMISDATAGGENLIGGGNGNFMAKPDTGQSPLAAYGRGMAQGRVNQPQINTGMM